MEGVGTPSLAIIGAGRAGSALAIAAHDAGYRVAAVASRRGEMAARLADTVGAQAVATPPEAAALADLTLLAVPDGAISTVAASIAASGISLRGRWRRAPGRAFRPGVDRVLARDRRRGRRAPSRSRRWPDRTARRSWRARSSVWTRAGSCGSGCSDWSRHFARRRSTSTRPSAPLYHAAAVLAGNAPLALLAEATRLLEATGIDAETAHAALAALLEGAAHNARRAGPAAALTGPVARGDTDAVAAHLEALETYPEARDLYLHLTRAMESLVATLPDATQPLASDDRAQVA